MLTFCNLKGGMHQSVTFCGHDVSCCINHQWVSASAAWKGYCCRQLNLWSLNHVKVCWLRANDMCENLNDAFVYVRCSQSNCTMTEAVMSVVFRCHCTR